MKFEENKYYKTRNGFKAIIYKIYPVIERIHGAYKLPDNDELIMLSWNLDGRRVPYYEDPFDLVSEWEDPEAKRRVWYSKERQKIAVLPDYVSIYSGGESDWEELEWLREP